MQATPATEAKPANPPAPSSLEAAEAALAAAKQATAPPELLKTWEQEVARRKEAAEVRGPPTLRARLATATSEANAAMQAREKAQRRVTAAKAEIEQAEEQLKTAAAEEERAAKVLRLVTAEVAPKKEEDAQTTAQAIPLNALATLLDAVKAASQGTEGAKARLEQATAQANKVLHPTPAPGAAAADVVMSTQAGDEDLDNKALETLLLTVHPSKRAQAAAQLTQLGVEEEQQQQQQQEEAVASASAAAASAAATAAAAAASAKATAR